jgi:hypothetical protein
MYIILALLITSCYLIGGQIEKSVRRYGVPTFAAAFVAIKNKGKNRYRALLLLGLIGILSIGYGEKSIIRKWVKADWATRLIYSQLLALIFILAGCKFYFAIPILAGAFQVRAGKIFSIGKFDVLIEDIYRALAIFICTLLTVAR